MRRKPKCGQTDGRKDRMIPVYPPNFVAGGITNFITASVGIKVKATRLLTLV